MMGLAMQWHKRQALLLATQLPDNHADALLVINALQELVETFLGGADEQPQQFAANVIPFVQLVANQL